jgi:glycosyltransferase involved in cell wall biosynthesis
MRIAIHLWSLDGGGAERVALYLTRSFLSSGVEVDMVLWNTRGSFLKNIPSGARLINLGDGGYALRLLAFIKWLVKNKPDALLCCQSLSNITGITANLLSGKKSRIILREPNTLERFRTETSWVLKRFPVIARLLYYFSNHIIAVSDSIAEDLRNILHIPANKITVIYNPIPTQKIKTLASIKPEHEWFKEDVPIIVGAGRLVPNKDFSTLLRAYAEIRKDKFVRLVIFGEGEQKQLLLDLAAELEIADDVDFPGFTENVFSYLAAASVFVLPSIFEGCPNILLEALACGCPVVATDCRSGPREILAGKHGLLVGVGAINEMARAISLQLEADTVLLPTNFNADDYDVQTVAGTYLSLLSE